MAQTRHQQQRVLRASLHAIDRIFWPMEESDSDTRIREKDATGRRVLGHKGKVLGWDVDCEYVEPSAASSVPLVLAFGHYPPSKKGFS
jgi:hypothetical protein